MSDVHETLQDLSHRRLRELKGGKHEASSLRSLHNSLPMNKVGKPLISYETLRQIHTGVHSGNISDETADALALMWRIGVDVVLKAAGQRPRLGPFELPSRAQRLTAKERRIVLGVIDAILEAGDEEAQVSGEEQEKVPRARTRRRTPAQQQTPATRQPVQPGQRS